MYRLFNCIADLKAFITKNESESNYAYLLYWFIIYFNYIKELDLYRQTASLLEDKTKKYLKRFTRICHFKYKQNQV